VGLILRGSVGGWGGRFTFPRSYVKGFATNWPPVAVSTLTDYEWRLTLDASYGFAYKTMEFKPQFWDWNSNTYTFDWIFENFYIVVPPRAPVVAEGFTLKYKVKPGTRDFYVAMDLGFWTTWFYVDPPPAPPTYWLPPL